MLGVYFAIYPKTFYKKIDSTPSYMSFGDFFFFQNNTNFKTILLFSIVAKLFSKLTYQG